MIHGGPGEILTLSDRVDGVPGEVLEVLKMLIELDFDFAVIEILNFRLRRVVPVTTLAVVAVVCIWMA